MIQPATTQDARREVARRKRVYSGVGFGPRSFECAIRGFGFSIDAGRKRASAPFNGNFIDVLGPQLYYWQPQRQVTYSPTLRAQGTAPPVITATWAFNGKFMPVQIKCTGAGALGAWTGTASFDGGGTTTAFTTVGLSGGVLALTGAGAGVVLTIAAGSASTNNQWDAVASKFADISGHGVDLTFGVGAEALITKGVNGQLGASSDGTTTIGNYTINFAAPATQPIWKWALWRLLVASSGASVLDSDSSAQASLFFYAGGGSTSAIQYNGTSGGSVSTPVGTWGRYETLFSGSANDYQKFGATASSPVTSGNNASTGTRGWFAEPTGGAKISAEFVAAGAMLTGSTGPSSGIKSALSAAVTSFYAGLIGV